MFKKNKKLKKESGSSFFNSPSKDSSIVTSTEDEFSVYGKHVANELRQVADDYAQQATKMKINTILFEARTGTYNKANTTQVQNQGSSSYQFVVCPPSTI